MRRICFIVVMTVLLSLLRESLVTLSIIPSVN